MAERLVDDIFTALDEQTVVVPGTGTLDVIVLSLAKSAAVHECRALEARIEALKEAHPSGGPAPGCPASVSGPPQSSCPPSATAAPFPPPPTWPHTPASPRQPGSPEPRSTANTPPGGGNRQLKRAMFLSAFAALHDPALPDLLRLLPNPRKTWLAQEELSASPASGSTCCSRCSATEPSTNPELDAFA